MTQSWYSCVYTQVWQHP